MICPLLAMRTGVPHRSVDLPDPTTYCQEGECAWWDSQSEHCAVHVLAWAMTETVEAQARRVDSYEDAH